MKKPRYGSAYVPQLSLLLQTLCQALWYVRFVTLVGIYRAETTSNISSRSKACQ